jgi:hypothetical protein
VLALITSCPGPKRRRKRRPAVRPINHLCLTLDAADLHAPRARLDAAGVQAPLEARHYAG